MSAPNNLALARPQQAAQLVQPGGLNQDQIDLIKRTIANGATNDELALFVMQCNRTGLDPFARQICMTKRAGKMVIQTTIDGYRLIADRSSKYAGSDDPLFDEGLNEYEHMTANRGNPKTATVTVYKLVGGVRCPFTATVRWEEYVPKGDQAFMWNKMPYLMLAKCAESLALRKAFPQELSGLYTNEEMAQAGGEVVDVTPVTPVTVGAKVLAASETQDAEGWHAVESAPQAGKTPVQQSTNGSGIKWPARPWDAQTCRIALAAKVEDAKLNTDDKSLTRGKMALLNLYPQDDSARHAITVWLFGKASSADLTPREAEAISQWAKCRKNDTGEWIPDMLAISEARAMVEAQMVAEGQQALFEQPAA